jgi:type IV fimbrial biogenesis protein FimT
MITLVVAIALIAIAVPSFQRLTLSNQLTTTANAFVGAISTARAEAIKRNSSTQVCGSTASSNTTADTLGKACTTEAGAVYGLTGAAATAVADQVRTAPTGLAAPLRISSPGMVALRFNGQGLAHDPTVSPVVLYGSLVVDICTGSMSTDNHRRITMTAGSIVAIANGSGACN